MLADGLGGHGGGELAAHLAVQAALACFRGEAGAKPGALLEAAQREILRNQMLHPMQSQMRTTAVVLVAENGHVEWAHVGDSRLYLFRAGRVVWQTKDHSVPQSLVNAGELDPGQIRFHEDRSRLVRSLGAEGAARPAVLDQAEATLPGDAFLLASDGFWEWVTEGEMEAELARAGTAEGWLAAMCARLRARASPDHDNYSAIAVFVCE
jgi:serine/threonine protein phosphatase PrpC